MLIRDLVDDTVRRCLCRYLRLWPARRCGRSYSPRRCRGRRGRCAERSWPSRPRMGSTRPRPWRTEVRSRWHVQQATRRESHRGSGPPARGLMVFAKMALDFVTYVSAAHQQVVSERRKCWPAFNSWAVVHAVHAAHPSADFPSGARVLVAHGRQARGSMTAPSSSCAWVSAATGLVGLTAGPPPRCVRRAAPTTLRRRPSSHQQPPWLS